MNKAYIMWNGCGEAEVLKNVMTSTVEEGIIVIDYETGPRTEENNYCIEYDTVYAPVSGIDWIKVENRNDDLA